MRLFNPLVLMSAKLSNASPPPSVSPSVSNSSVSLPLSGVLLSSSLTFWLILRNMPVPFVSSSRILLSTLHEDVRNAGREWPRRKTELCPITGSSWSVFVVPVLSLSLLFSDALPVTMRRWRLPFIDTAKRSVLLPSVSAISSSNVDEGDLIAKGMLEKEVDC